MLSWFNGFICICGEVRIREGPGWPHVTQSLCKDSGFLRPGSPSHLTAPCSCACCSLLLDCPLLSPAPNLHVTFTLQQDVTSLQRLPRGPPETTLVAEHGLLCILSSDFCSLLSPHRTCRDLEREFKALHKRKAFATEDG